MLGFAIALAVCFGLESTAASTVTMSFTQATLLSGGFFRCPAPYNGSGCVNGIAEASLARRLYAPGSVFLAQADWAEAFVQMHPLLWGVNGPVLQRASASAFFATHSMLGSRSWPDAWQSPVRMLMSNAVLNTDNQWFGATTAYLIDRTKGYALLYAYDSTNGAVGSLPAAPAIAALYHTLRRAVPHVIVIAFTAATVSEFAARIHGAGATPAAVLSLGSAETPTVINGTAVAGIGLSPSHLSVLNFTNTSGGPVVSTQRYSLSIPPATRTADAQYVADQAYMQSLAAVAAANNPIVGRSTVAMPAVRVGDYRACFGGECELGNLWADALRARYPGTDVAFFPVSGIRGPGWPAGDVRTAHIFASDPFQNTICNGTVLGVTLFRIFNNSISKGGFVSERTATGGRLLQVSGARLTFNLGLTPTTRRLVKVEVLDPATGAFVPLVRTRLYRYTTVSFLCTSYDIYPALLAGTLRGERAPQLVDDIIQNVVAAHITSASPITPAIHGRLVNDTTAAAVASWELTSTSCDQTAFFDSGLSSCVACPTGQEQARGGTSCVPVTEAASNVVLYASVASAAALVLAMLFALIAFLLLRQGGVRDVGNAPRENPTTILFTDIQSSTLLWTHAPQSMSDALSTHHRIIRACIAKHKGYEVKTAGDAFMIAVKSAESGLRLALDIQTELLRQPWPEALDQVYLAAASDLEPVVDDDPERVLSAPAGALWGGLRVRIGLQTGEADVTFDEVAKGYDYYGPPVNAAARVESQTRGGEICTTRSVLDAVSSELKTGLTIQSRGEFDLRGIAEPLELWQVLPTALAGRRYAEPSKALAAGQDKEDAFADNMHSSDTDRQSAARSTAECGVPLGPGEEPLHVFFQAALRALRPREKKDVLASLARAWHLTGSGENTITALLTKRAARVAKVSGVMAEPALGRSGLGHSSMNHSDRGLERSGWTAVTCTTPRGHPVGDTKPAEVDPGIV